MRDFAHYEYDWPNTVDSLTEDGPEVPTDLEVTKGYNAGSGLNRLWQFIFGIRGQALVYIQLPTDLKRHGVPKKAWPSSTLRRVCHFEDWMSPWREPSFITEHFMKRPEAARLDFTIYNPNAIDLTELKLNFFINKMITERVGTENYSASGLQLTPTRARFSELLKKLYQRTVPCRPITIQPVRAPAEAPRGE